MHILLPLLKRRVHRHNDGSHLGNFLLKAPRDDAMCTFSGMLQHTTGILARATQHLAVELFEPLDPGLAKKSNICFFLSFYRHFFGTRSCDETLLRLKAQADVKQKKVVTSHRRKSVTPITDANVCYRALLRTCPRHKKLP